MVKDGRELRRFGRVLTSNVQVIYDTLESFIRPSGRGEG